MPSDAVEIEPEGTRLRCPRMNDAEREQLMAESLTYQYATMVLLTHVSSVVAEQAASMMVESEFAQYLHSSLSNTPHALRNRLLALAEDRLVDARGLFMVAGDTRPWLNA